MPCISARTQTSAPPCRGGHCPPEKCSDEAHERAADDRPYGATTAHQCGPPVGVGHPADPKKTNPTVFCLRQNPPPFAREAYTGGQSVRPYKREPKFPYPPVGRDDHIPPRTPQKKPPSDEGGGLSKAKPGGREKCRRAKRGVSPSVTCGDSSLVRGSQDLTHNIDQSIFL